MKALEFLQKYWKAYWEHYRATPPWIKLVSALPDVALFLLLCWIIFFLMSTIDRMANRYNRLEAACPGAPYIPFNPSL